jgi:hypothetical protein
MGTRSTIAIATAISLFAGSAFAEEVYDPSNEAHQEDLICIAALSVARDLTFDVNRDLFRELTSIQNDFILRYNRVPTRHIDAKKILINMRMDSIPNYLESVITQCSERV